MSSLKDTKAAISGPNLDVAPALYYPSNPDYPPVYHETEDDLNTRIQQFLDRAHHHAQPLPILTYPIRSPSSPPLTPPQILAQEIITTYFTALHTKNSQIISLLLSSNLVSTATTSSTGLTPLLAATTAAHPHTVQQLMHFSADINAFGTTSSSAPPSSLVPSTPTLRTPLMLAAATGNLAIVKLLIETYAADDALIAPDGATALRLAAAGRHREIVKYLPARRGGGWRRWKTRHAVAMARARRAVKGVGLFVRVLGWEMPRFLLWEVPRHVVWRPVWKGVRWVWVHRREVPGMVVGWGKRVWGAVKRVPRGVWRGVKGLGRAVRDLGGFVWRGIRNLPRAMKIAVVWMWSGIKNAGAAVANVFVRLVSVLHTALAAIATFFREITLRDVWNGFVAFLHTLVVDGPKKIWAWMCKFEEVMVRAFRALWGCTGEIIYILLRLIVEVFIYVPKKVAVILWSFCLSIGKGFEEALIWINPKRC